MNTHEQTLAPKPEEQHPWPSAWRLFWGVMIRPPFGSGHLGSDGRPSKWAKWSWYSVALFAGGIAAQAALMGRIPEILLDGGQFLVSCAAMGMLYWATWRHIQEDLDELHRRIMLESIVFAFFVTITLAVALGVLSNFSELPAINLLWVFFTAELLRAAGLVLAVRKYR